MKILKATLFTSVSCMLFSIGTAQSYKEASSLPTEQKVNHFLDVHQFGPGKVTFKDVSKAHLRDLEVEHMHNVHFKNFWVDENNGLVYCLSTAPDEEAIVKTHEEAHGLLPQQVYQVKEGQAEKMKGNTNLFLDFHYFGKGNVTQKDVAAAHAKDLESEKKTGVNFINYWVDEKEGLVICLSEAADSSAIRKTHAMAHGLLPSRVLQVKQGE